MAERLIQVVVDEALAGMPEKSYLRIELIVDGAVEAVVGILRSSSPQEISRFLEGTGCFIKYDECIELSEEERERLGDIHIEASYNVPGLREK